MADAWANRPAEVNESTENIVSLLERLGEPAAPDSPIEIDAALIGNLIDRSTADYEPHFGGFGHAPKFPRQTVLEMLLTYLDSPLDEQATGARTPKARVRAILLHTLDAMMHGGIRDHLGGGFHRYSTDAKWLVPHFEIMLYDNAMLLAVYALAHRQTADPAVRAGGPRHRRFRAAGNDESGRGFLHRDGRRGGWPRRAELPLDRRRSGSRIGRWRRASVQPGVRAGSRSEL